MKLRASVRIICIKCRLICRCRQIRVIYSNLKHKQRQGNLSKRTLLSKK